MIFTLQPGICIRALIPLVSEKQAFKTLSNRRKIAENRDFPLLIGPAGLIY